MSDFKKYFTDAVRKNFPDKHEALVKDTERHFAIISADTVFGAKSSNPVDKRLDMSAYFLAFIMMLEQQGKSFEEIRKICLDVVTEYVRPKNKMQQWFKRLPVVLLPTVFGRLLIRWMKKKTTQKAHPDGFLVDIITDPKETYGFGYGFDILDCGICKLFKKHNAYKYASILCEVDEMTSALAGLRLIRNGTIANGAKKCDFRFEKVNAGKTHV